MEQALLEPNRTDWLQNVISLSRSELTKISRHDRYNFHALHELLHIDVDSQSIATLFQTSPQFAGLFVIELF